MFNIVDQSSCQKNDIVFNQPQLRSVVTPNSEESTSNRHSNMNNSASFEGKVDAITDFVKNARQLTNNNHLDFDAKFSEICQAQDIQSLNKQDWANLFSKLVDTLINQIHTELSLADNDSYIMRTMNFQIWNEMQTSNWTQFGWLSLLAKFCAMCQYFGMNDEQFKRFEFDRKDLAPMLKHVLSGLLELTCDRYFCPRLFGATPNTDWMDSCSDLGIFENHMKHWPRLLNRFEIELPTQSICVFLRKIIPRTQPENWVHLLEIKYFYNQLASQDTLHTESDTHRLGISLRQHMQLLCSKKIYWPAFYDLPTDPESKAYKYGRSFLSGTSGILTLLQYHVSTEDILDAFHELDQHCKLFNNKQKRNGDYLKNSDVWYKHHYTHEVDNQIKLWKKAIDSAGRITDQLYFNYKFY